MISVDDSHVLCTSCGPEAVLIPASLAVSLVAAGRGGAAMAGRLTALLPAAATENKWFAIGNLISLQSQGAVSIKGPSFQV